jgi:hypothetical protein
MSRSLFFATRQSIAFSDDRQGMVQQLVIDGYVVRNGDLYELGPGRRR